MSIPRKHPVVETGDGGQLPSGCYSLGHCAAWRVDGIRDQVSDRGALHISKAPLGAGVDLSVYSDRARQPADLVAQVLGAPVGGRVTATPVNNSRLTVSAVITDNAQNDNLTLWVELATLDDLRDREDQVISFFEGSAPLMRFRTISLACMRQLYLNIQAIYPPPQRAGAPLSLYGTSPAQIRGQGGLPDPDAQDFWSLNPEGDWELVGLQNIADFKEWAIAWSLGLTWKRRAGSVEDPVLKRAQLYFEEAAEQWSLLPFLVDFDRDGTPERKVRRASGLISRG